MATLAFVLLRRDDNDFGSQHVFEEFPGGSAGLGSAIVTVVARVTAAVWVQSLTQKLLFAMGVAKNKSKIKKKNKTVPTPRRPSPGVDTGPSLALIFVQAPLYVPGGLGSGPHRAHLSPASSPTPCRARAPIPFYRQRPL